MAKVTIKKHSGGKTVVREFLLNQWQTWVTDDAWAARKSARCRAHVMAKRWGLKASVKSVPDGVAVMFRRAK